MLGEESCKVESNLLEKFNEVTDKYKQLLLEKQDWNIELRDAKSKANDWERANRETD